MENERTMSCAICETRRPRRPCPGLRSDICAVCCGTSREVSVRCPLECAYLQEARKYEKPPERDPESLPNKDVEIPERFLNDNGQLFGFTCQALVRIALGSAGVVDKDVREALDSLTKTFRTMESGLIYETRPANLLAAAIQQQLRDELDGLRKHMKERLGMETVRDSDVLGVLILLQRTEFARGNDRPLGRAFIDFLCQEFPVTPAAGQPGSSGLIIPG